MATARDIINRAIRRINVLAAEEALSDADMADSLQTFNDMLAGFGPKGIGYVHQTLGLTDTVNFPDEQIDNVIYMLADRLADDFGMNLGPKLSAAINQAKLELQAAYLEINPAVPDRALRRRRPGFFDWERGE